LILLTTLTALWLNLLFGNLRGFQNPLELVTYFRHPVLAWVNKPLKAVTLVDLYRYVDSRGNLASATKARIVNTLKSLFRFAHEAGYCPVNVALKLKPPKVRNRLAERLLTQQDVVRLIENEKSDRNKVLLLLAYTTGLRVSEICGLKWRDLVAKEGGGQLVVRGKGGKTRYLWLPTPVWMAVERLRGTASASDPVFSSRKKGGHLSRSMVMRIVRAAALKAGIDAPVSPALVETRPRISCFGARSAATFGAAYLRTLANSIRRCLSPRSADG
jgi:integrase/recombinase XerD